MGASRQALIRPEADFSGAVAGKAGVRQKPFASPWPESLIQKKYRTCRKEGYPKREKQRFFRSVKPTNHQAHAACCHSLYADEHRKCGPYEIVPMSNLHICYQHRLRPPSAHRAILPAPSKSFLRDVIDAGLSAAASCGSTVADQPTLDSRDSRSSESGPIMNCQGTD